MTGKTVFWNGDNANDPRNGVVVSANGSLLEVQWSDGLRQVIPAFVVRAANGWRLA